MDICKFLHGSITMLIQFLFWICYIRQISFFNFLLTFQISRSWIIYRISFRLRSNLISKICARMDIRFTEILSFIYILIYLLCRYIWFVLSDIILLIRRLNFESFY